MFKRTESDHDWHHVTSTGEILLKGVPWLKISRQTTIESTLRHTFLHERHLLGCHTKSDFVVLYRWFLPNICPMYNLETLDLSDCQKRMKSSKLSYEQFIRDFDASISDVSSTRICGQCSRKCARKTLSQWINEITRWYANWLCQQVAQGMHSTEYSDRMFLRWKFD